MSPEEIVSLIGNVANRPDLREVQERQVKEIKALILAEREECAKLIEYPSPLVDPLFDTWNADPEEVRIAIRNKVFFYE